MKTSQIQEKAIFFGKLIVQTQASHIFLILATVLVLGNFLFIKPLQFLVAKEKQELSDFKQRYELRKKLVLNSQNLETFLSDQRKRLNHLKQATFGPGQQAKVITALADMTEALGIKVVKINPASQELKKETGVDSHHSSIPLHAYPIEMELLGHYPELGTFLEMLREGPLYFQIETLEIGPRIEESLLKGTLKVSAFEERAKP